MILFVLILHQNENFLLVLCAPIGPKLDNNHFKDYFLSYLMLFYIKNCLLKFIEKLLLHYKNKIFISREHLSKQKLIFQTDRNVLL